MSQYLDRLSSRVAKNLATYLKEQRETTSRNLPTPHSALAIGAHPDDIEFGCGGTLAKWAKEGTQVHSAILTDGSKGSWEGATDPRGLARTRELEARNAALRLTGSHDVRFLGQVDGELHGDRVLVENLCQIIRETKPEVVLGHDPWQRYRLHPDHRHAGWLTTDAIVAARDPLFFPHQPFAAHRPQCLLLWEADTVDHYEEIENSLPTKYEALLCHVSQYITTLGIDSPTDELGRRAFRERLQEVHRKEGSKGGLGASESFKLIAEL